MSKWPGPIPRGKNIPRQQDLLQWRVILEQFLPEFVFQQWQQTASHSKNSECLISYRHFTQLAFTTNCWSREGKKVHIQGLWSRMWLLSTFASCFKETRCCVHVCVAFKGCVKLLFIHANPHHWDSTCIKSALTQETRQLSAKHTQRGNFLLQVWNFSCQSCPKVLNGKDIVLIALSRANQFTAKFWFLPFLAYHL